MMLQTPTPGFALWKHPIPVLKPGLFCLQLLAGPELGCGNAAWCRLVRASSNQPTPVNSVLSSALCRERASAIAPFVQGSGLLPYRIFDDICAAPANGMPPAHQGTRCACRLPHCAHQRSRARAWVVVRRRPACSGPAPPPTPGSSRSCTLHPAPCPRRPLKLGGTRHATRSVPLQRFQPLCSWMPFVTRQPGTTLRPPSLLGSCPGEPSCM